MHTIIQHMKIVLGLEFGFYCVFRLGKLHNNYYVYNAEWNSELYTLGQVHTLTIILYSSLESLTILLFIH